MDLQSVKIENNLRSPIGCFWLGPATAYSKGSRSEQGKGFILATSFLISLYNCSTNRFMVVDKRGIICSGSEIGLLRFKEGTESRSIQATITGESSTWFTSTFPISAPGQTAESGILLVCENGVGTDHTQQHPSGEIFGGNATYP